MLFYKRIFVWGNYTLKNKGVKNKWVKGYPVSNLFSNRKKFLHFFCKSEIHQN